MSRLQQKSSGKRIRREPLGAADIKEGLKKFISRKDMALPRFGEMDLKRKRK